MAAILKALLAHMAAKSSSNLKREMKKVIFMPKRAVENYESLGSSRFIFEKRECSPPWLYAEGNGGSIFAGCFSSRR